MTAYKAKLKEFVSTKIQPSVLGSKEVLSRYYYVAPNTEDNLGSVNILYTYKTGETYRTTELAEVTLTSNVENKAIAEGTQKTPAVSVKTTKVFDFDAKENFANQDIADLLYEAAGYSNADVKLFNEFENNYDKTRSFSILLKNGSNLQIKNVFVSAEDDSAETLKNNLTDLTKHRVENGT